MSNAIKIATTISEMKALRRQLPEPVGFVPTMGYLHEGHLRLVRQAKAENATVVVSIFVNPTQFGPSEDFEKYPRDAERDTRLLETEGVDVLFMPETSAMYPEAYNAWVDLEGITAELEGASRPGHFKGVTTVVTKLFNITDPDRAYFGQKDAQQLLVIRKMVSELNMNLQVVTVPTVRESDGLAMSSRNVYLTPDQRKQAPVLFESLQMAQALWEDGERQAQKIRQQMIQRIESAPDARIDYVSIADIKTLQEVERADRPVLISLAVRFGKTRLIDNILLENDQ